MQSACILSPGLKQLEQERENRRYICLSSTIDTLFVEQTIHEKLDQQKALDIFWTFTGRDLYRLFVIERAWSPEDYENWLSETLSNLLLRK